MIQCATTRPSLLFQHNLCRSLILPVQKFVERITFGKNAFGFKKNPLKIPTNLTVLINLVSLSRRKIRPRQKYPIWKHTTESASVRADKLQSVFHGLAVSKSFHSFTITMISDFTALNTFHKGPCRRKTNKA